MTAEEELFVTAPRVSSVVPPLAGLFSVNVEFEPVMVTLPNVTPAIPVVTLLPP